MSNLKKNAKSNKNATSTGLSLQGSQINLSTRLSNFNISNPLQYLYNENVDTPSRGRPMSASTLGATYQESPRRSKLVKRPQSADTINKITKNRHITFHFNDQQNDTGVVGGRVRLETAFDELDAAEPSPPSSPGCGDGGGSGRSSPAPHYHRHASPAPRYRPSTPPSVTGPPDDDDERTALEPGLASKPPLPPAGHADGDAPPTGRDDAAAQPPSKGPATTTFDDAIELKFQRWFPNSVAAASDPPAASVAAVAALVAAAAPPPPPPPPPPSSSSSSSPFDGGGGVSYESYRSERVFEDDRGATVTYTRSSSSLSVRGCGQDQLDEEHLYSNLSAAIGVDRLKSDASRRDAADNCRRSSSSAAAAAAKSKRKAKRTPPAQHQQLQHQQQQLQQQNGRAKRDAAAIKSAMKAPRAKDLGAVPSPSPPPQRNDHRAADDRDAKRTEHRHHPKKTDDSPVDDVREDVVSWMSSHQPTPSSQTPEIDDAPFDAFRKQNDRHETSTYDEIVNILKELESENNDIDMNVRKSGVTDNNKHQTLVPEPSSSSKALWSFLDEVEKNSVRSTPSKPPKLKSPVRLPNTPPPSPGKQVADEKKGNLQQVIELGKAELAQKVATLQLQLAEKEDMTEKLKMTVTELQAEHAKSKAEYESTVTRHQKFIDKLLNEKKELSENCAVTVKELTKKMNDTLASQEERHRVELKKAVDKQTASDKIKKDRWVDLKTKKIKEMTIKGIEPELNRISAAYQEELAELRRIHQSQVEEIEATWHRRMASMRDKMDAEREQAIITERENSRNRLEMEIAELEKSYQDQRKRLLGEIHGERLRQERENEVVLIEKQRALEQKFEKLVIELKEKINKKEQEFQNELKSVKETCESEKTNWIQHQTAVLAEKENAFKETCKKERDKHIELVVQKLENEAFDREKSSETKIKRIKSDYEADIHELENTISGHRLKLNEARTKAQEYEDKIADLSSELNKCHIEQKRLQDLISKLKEDLTVKETIIKNETVTKAEILNQSKLNFEAKIKTIENEKEREINHVYVRVREAIKRKDEAIQALQSERDAALDQCSNLERLYERQRKELLKFK